MGGVGTFRHELRRCSLLMMMMPFICSFRNKNDPRDPKHCSFTRSWGASSGREEFGIRCSPRRQPVLPAGHGLGSLETWVSTEPLLALDSLAPAGFGIRGRSQQPMLPAGPGLGSPGIEISEGPLLALDLQSWPLRGSSLAPSGFGSRISPGVNACRVQRQR